MEQKPATIKQIAKQLNVSVSTVSRALKDHPSIGLRTRMQVKKLAEELGYEPNQAAISFKQGKTFTIGVILPNLGEEFFSIAINGIEEVATAAGYTVLIGQSHDEVEREIRIAETMRKHRVDGLIVSLSKTTQDLGHFDQLRKYNIPVVFFDRVPGTPDSFSVSCQLQGITTLMIDKLVERGHRLIGFINGPEDMKPSVERLKGYREGLKKHGLDHTCDSCVVNTDLSGEATRKAVQQLLALKKRPTAIIAFNDYVALEAGKEVRKAGLVINRDIFFVSYANLPITTYLENPPLLSVEQYPFQQAEEATRMLLSLVDFKTAIPEDFKRQIIFESKLVEYETP